MPRYDDDGGWGGGFMPWGLFRFRPTTQETKEAGPKTDWGTPLLQGATAGLALFLGGALTYAALCSWDVAAVRTGLAVAFGLAGILAALLAASLLEDEHIAVRLGVAFVSMLGLFLAGDWLSLAWHGGDAAAVVRQLPVAIFGLIGLVLGPTILLQTKDVRASFFYPALFWLVGGGLWWITPRMAQEPWWPPMLTLLAVSVDASAVTLGYNFFRELIDNWRPFPPLERVMLQYMDRMFPEIAAKQETPTFQITVQQGAHQLRLGDLRGEAEDVYKFAGDALAGRLAIGKTLPRAAFGDLAGQAETAGLIRLRNPRNIKDGFRITKKGEAVFPAVIQEIDNWEPQV